MKRLALWLFPAILFGGEVRYARLGEFQGNAEVQLQAADAWLAAERNLPLLESTWVRTGASSQLEIELDEGSAWRLGPDSQGEISDYSRLSTGQRVTLLSLDRGLAYFTGEPKGNDSLSLAVPGAQIVFIRGARIRLEAQERWSIVSVIEGKVRYSSPTAEIDLLAGQTLRLEPENPARFFLDREVKPMDLDHWSEARDKAEAFSTSAGHVLERCGLADLDAAGTWIETDEFGAVWKPRAPDGWVPFQNGRWRWYTALGYTWVSGDAWGWLPYHYGRWAHRENLGWVWAPSVSTVFKPGEVYWMRGRELAGWGPLAPGEPWPPTGPEGTQPQQYANAYTTYAAFQQDARMVDPAGFTARPKDPLAAAPFTAALPSPAFLAARLDAVRPVLRAGSTRLAPVIPGVTFQDDSDTFAAPPAAPEPAPPAEAQGPEVTPPPPEQVIEQVPVYAGIVVVRPPRNDKPPAQPVRASVQPSPQPPPPKQRPRPEPPRRIPLDREEAAIYSVVVKDVQSNDPAKAIQDLDTWSKRFPRSDLQNDRLYLYMQSYSRVKPPQPAIVVGYGAQLMAKDLKATLSDPESILVVLYLMTVNVVNIPNPSEELLVLGDRAASELLAYVPEFFTPARKPAGTSDADWAKTRTDMEAVAKQALATMVMRVNGTPERRIIPH
jgi:outer membrane biosynthesis protein TonB